MEVSYVGEAVPGEAPTYVLATDGVFLAYAETGTGLTHSVSVVYLRNPAAPALRLWSHLQDRAVTALCVGAGATGSSDPNPYDPEPQHQALLAVATSDAVVVWGLAAAYAAAAEGHQLPQPTLLLERPGTVDALVLGSATQQLAVCAGAVVHVFSLPSLRNTHRLEGHGASVLAAAFCAPHAPHLLVTAGEDRTFRVWDLDGSSLAYQSSILTASPLLSLAVDPSFPRLAVGSADGVVRFFDLAGLPAVRPLATVDVSRQLTRLTDKGAAAAAAAAAAGGADGPVVVSAAPAWQRVMAAQAAAAGGGDNDGGDGDDDDDGSHVVLAGNNASIVAMLFVPPPPPPPRGACTPRGGDGHHHHLARGPGGGGGGDGGMGLLAESPRLMLGTTRALALLDAQTYELAEAHFLRGGLPSEDAIWDHVARARRGSAATGAGQLPPQQLRLLPEASTAGAYALALAHGGGSGVAVAISAARQPSIAIFSIEQRRPPSPAPPAPGFDASLAAAAAGGGGGARTPLGDTAYEGSYASTSGGGNDDALFSAGRSAARDGSGGDARAPVSVFTTQPLPEGSYLRPLGSAPSSASGSPGRPGLPPRASPSKPSLGGKPGAGAGASSSPLARSSSTGSASVRFGGRPRSTVKPLTNQPVTFHKKVKSSGYGFVQPQIRIGATPPKKVAVSKSGSAATSALGRHFVQQRTYPLGCGPLVHAQPGNALPGGARAHNGAVLHLAFSPDARRLLTCSADKTARAMRLPLSTHAGDGTDFVAHDGAVTSACWSHDGTMVLTASADRTARMWNAGFAQPLLEFSHVNCQAPIAPSLKLPPISPSPGARGRSASAPIGSERPSPLALPRATQPADAANRPFAAEVRAAWFFYMDEFVIVASGPRLHLYRYKLLESADDDLERLRNNNKYKLVASYTSGSQAITDACCINTFLSPIALLTGSNKTIEVVDMSTMQRISCIEDVHARPANAIVQAVSSLYVSHPKEAYELFATSAPDNTAKLWDVRCARCVRTFTGHRSSQLPVGLAFSPCLRYLATGSEDRSAYLYDLRQGSVLHRLRGTHGDAVIDVAFNPLHPQLATGCLDGKVHFFSDAL